MTKSSKAAHEHFQAIAAAIPTEGLDVCRADVEIVRVNLDRGVAAIAPHLATIQENLPK